MPLQAAAVSPEVVRLSRIRLQISLLICAKAAPTCTSFTSSPLPMGEGFSVHPKRKMYLKETR